ncbi:hypothetical protein PtrSN002B_006138, partial [Pyrenophora tritici-repentis]
MEFILALQGYEHVFYGAAPVTLAEAGTKLALEIGRDPVESAHNRRYACKHHTRRTFRESSVLCDLLAKRMEPNRFHPEDRVTYTTKLLNYISSPETWT